MHKHYRDFDKLYLAYFIFFLFYTLWGPDRELASHAVISSHAEVTLSELVIVNSKMKKCYWSHVTCDKFTSSYTGQ